jgi:hypothetical protein
VADTISISASIRIKAPVDVVRAQYRDIDHHIRANVHPDVTYQWEPAGPGERKVRRTFSVMGVPQSDVSFLEDRRDGTFVIRFVEGANAGMVMRHEFVGSNSGTEVKITAEAPATVGRKLLGPLYRLGALQGLKKAMAEDKADLEQGGYQMGRAPRNLAQVLGALDAVKKRGDAQAARAILQAGCILSAADASLHDAERDALEIIADKLGIEAGDLEDTVTQMAASSGFAADARAVGESLAKHGVAKEGILAGAAVALVSEGMSLGELAALRAIALGAGVADDDVQALVEKVDVELGA